MGIAAARLLPKSVCVLALAAILAPAVAQAAPAIDLYYERALMSSAGDRCGLFTPAIGAALHASAAQARGAALRAGVDSGVIRDTGARAAAKVSAVGCASPDLKVAADRVRTAFDGWSKIARMDFPGEDAPWRVDRNEYRSQRWRLVQPSTAAGAPVLFGVAGQRNNAAFVAVAAFADGARPYAARLVYRDAARAPSPWVGAPQNRPLPPRAASRFVLAQDVATADPTLAPGDRDDAVIFRFPTSAVDDITALDPRERFAVEFLFANDEVRTAPFEVGDLAAGRAFLGMGTR
jgi:hypothetical protein